MQGSSIPIPANIVEAHLLLETAINNCKICCIEKSLVDQVVHHDALQLHYSHLQVKKVESKLADVELCIGQVWMVVRHSGYSPDVGEFCTTPALPSF